MFENESERLKIELEKENAALSGTEISECDDSDTSAEKQLKRDIKAAALERLENAARTEDDFQKVIELWDKRDANRERKERYHEICRGDNIPLDYNADENGICFPRSINKYLWKQIQKGDFIEAIYNCPHELQELISEPYLSQIISELTDEHKEILYYMIRGYSTVHIAKIRGQSDRNIRKVRKTLLNKIRKKIYEYLIFNKQHGMTAQEKKFVANYRKPIDNGE